MERRNMQNKIDKQTFGDTFKKDLGSGNFARGRGQGNYRRGFN